MLGESHKTSCYLHQCKAIMQELQLQLDLKDQEMQKMEADKMRERMAHKEQLTKLDKRIAYLEERLVKMSLELGSAKGFRQD